MVSFTKTDFQKQKLEDNWIAAEKKENDTKNKFDENWHQNVLWFKIKKESKFLPFNPSDLSEN